jgi:hypothetical protein
MNWPEGDRLLNVTYKWCAEKHAALGSPMFVTGDCCKRLEDIAEHIYSTRDAEKMKAACKAFGHHMHQHFIDAAAKRQREGVAL